LRLKGFIVVREKSVIKCSLTHAKALSGVLPPHFPGIHVLDRVKGEIPRTPTVNMEESGCGSNAQLGSSPSPFGPKIYRRVAEVAPPDLSRTLESHDQ
jgi:hypothetical protein